MSATSGGDLLLRAYSMKEYCVGAGNQVVRDFPSPRLFRPDADHEVCCYDLATWDEPRIRRHIGDSRARNRHGEVRAKDATQYGLAAIRESEIAEPGRYSVVKNVEEANELIPQNDAHCAIKVDPSIDKDTAEWEIFSIAAGYSPPPTLRDVKDLTRCKPGELISQVTPLK